MKTQTYHVAFYKRRRPGGFAEIKGYDQALRDFVKETALTVGKTLDETIDYMGRFGMVHPLEADYLQAHLDTWGTL